MALTPPRVKCCLCTEFVQQKYYRDHLMNHLDYSPFICTFENCFEKFSSEKMIHMHSDIKHGCLKKILCNSDRHCERMLSKISELCVNKKELLTAPMLDKLFSASTFKNCFGSAKVAILPKGESLMPDNLGVSMPQLPASDFDYEDKVSSSDAADTIGGVDNSMNNVQISVTSLAVVNDNSAIIPAGSDTHEAVELPAVQTDTRNSATIETMAKQCDIKPINNHLYLSELVKNETPLASQNDSSSVANFVPVKQEKIILKIQLNRSQEIKRVNRPPKSRRHSKTTEASIKNSPLKNNKNYCTSSFANCMNQQKYLNYVRCQQLMFPRVYPAVQMEPVMDEQPSQINLDNMNLYNRDSDLNVESSEQRLLGSDHVFKTINDVIKNATASRPTFITAQSHPHNVPKKYTTKIRKKMQPDKLVCQALNISQAKAKYGSIMCVKCSKQLAKEKVVLHRHAISHMSQSSNIYWMYECLHCEPGRRRTAFKDTMITRHLRDKHNIKPSFPNIDYIDRSKAFTDKIHSIYLECFPLLQNNGDNHQKNSANLFNTNIEDHRFSAAADIKTILPILNVPHTGISGSQFQPKNNDVNPNLDSLMHSLKTELPLEPC